MLSYPLMEAGYVPNTNFVLRDVENEGEERLLSFHSERLAIALGLINLSCGQRIRIIKISRVCDDNHNAISWGGSLSEMSQLKEM
ncbi:hypothetical protein O6H91_17G077400 [Diphasiastrum complanatum]|uniref:Uncharacterized protein n=1 Tax=Diphasiastrum complanatum TaxID=34168 RepID=A0ACC2B8C3_DIPCM|nr:hypothetical protein O6H91_17G077400 [Diphasiastrum complanatum]